MKASKFKAFSILALFLLGIMSVAVSAINIDPSSVEVKINGEKVAANGGDTLDIQRGQNVEVKVRFKATGNDSNIELHAFIAGYEYGDRETLADQTHVFDIESGVTYTETLNLKLPDRLDKQMYRLRLFFADNDDPITMSDYYLKVSTERHQITIKDVVLSPENSVAAGRALIGVVRVQNTGDKDEESVKVKMSIPELGVAATDYIDQIDAEETKTTEELYIRIPTCATAGTYQVIVEVSFDEGYETVTAKETITVTEGDACGISPKQGIKVTVPASTQPVNAGEQVLFPITIQNLGKDSKQVTVTAQAGSAMTVSISEPVVILNGEETKVVIVQARAAKDAAGEQVITLKVGAGDNTQDITLRASVSETSNTWDKVKKGLEVGLVILVVLLVILGLIIGFNRLKGSEDESEDKAQTYY